MGMLSWQPGDQQRLLKQLVANLQPGGVAGETPCLPAHLLFMCLRYADYCSNETQAMGLLEGVVSSLRGMRVKPQIGLDPLVFWLANMLQFNGHLQRYSAQQVRPDLACEAPPPSMASHTHYHLNPLQSRLGSLENFDLSEYETVLSQQATLFYHRVVEVIHGKFRHLIGQFTVEPPIKDPPKKGQPPNKGLYSVLLSHSSS